MYRNKPTEKFTPVVHYYTMNAKGIVCPFSAMSKR